MAGSTPIYGFPYPQSTDLVADYPTLGQELATDVETVMSGISGLKNITPTSVANTGGSATVSGGQVTFTGVSSISLNGVFTSAYDNYRIIFCPGNSGASAALTMRFRASGTDKSTSLYYYGGLDVNQSGGSGARAVGAGTAIALTTLSAAFGTLCNYSIDVYRPALSTVQTGFSYLSANNDGSQNFGAFVGGTWYETSAVDGVSFILASSNFSGTIRVYGYKNS